MGAVTPETCTRASQMKSLNILYPIIDWTQKVHNDLIFLCSLHCVAISFTVTRRFSFTMASTAAMPSGVTTGCAWPGWESVSELMPFMNFLFHSYTCCSDRHASPYWTFIRDGFRFVSPLHYLNNGWQNAVLLWCMLQAGPPSLHYYCAVVLHSCIVLPPVGHSSKHEYRCCQLTDNRTVFRIFIALLRFSFDSPPYIASLSVPLLPPNDSKGANALKVW